jgi:hypothetical protein
MKEMRVNLDTITQDDLRFAATSIDDVQDPLYAAGASYVEGGLDDAITKAQSQSGAFHARVLDILYAVYENDPPQPNDCGECGRSFGPHYTGPCEH